MELFKFVLSVVTTFFFTLAMIKKINEYTGDTFATILILAIGFFVGSSIVATFIRFYLL